MVDVNNINSRTTNSPVGNQKANNRASITDENSENSAQATNSFTTQKTEEVHLTNTANQFLEAVKTAKDAPDVNQEKVERVRKSIEDGTYNLDSQQTAEKIVALESALAQTK